MNKLLLTLPLLFILSGPAIAGEGHDHTSTGEGNGSLQEIVLTKAMMTNLGIKTEAATLKDVSRTADMVADVAYFPERQAIVSTRVEGSVLQIFVHPGEEVRKGQEIVTLQPRLIGSPVISLTAPIAGFVTEQNVVIGQSVSPDQPIVRIADISKVLVKGKAYEDIAQNGIKVGQKVTVTTPAIPGEIFNGTVHHVDAALQSGTRIREIDCLVENPEGKLLANMQANLAINVGNPVKSLIVPQRAVLGELGNYFIYVQEDDHFYRRDVTLGQKYGPFREIIDGVSPDEQVVTVGNYQLQFITPPKKGGEDDEHGHSH